jgi:integrase
LPRGADGQRRTTTKTIYGGKRDAQAALRAALAAVDRNEHIEPSRVTVAQYVRARIEQWLAVGKISERTCESYRTVANVIARHLGEVRLQALRVPDVEEFHAAMRSAGLTRTAQAAHNLLARTFDDAIRHDLLSRNVAQLAGPPRVRQSARMVIPSQEQIHELLAKLAGDPWYTSVVVACIRVSGAASCLPCAGIGSISTAA